MSEPRMIIYKYKLQIVDSQVLRLPNNSVFMRVEVQNKLPVVWALVDVKQEEVEVTIKTYGTGLPILPGVKKESFLGTYQIENHQGYGLFVGHVFLKLSPDES